MKKDTTMARTKSAGARRWTRGILAAAAVALGTVTGCGSNGEAAQDGQNKDALTAATHEEQVNVVVQELKAGRFSTRLTLVGEIKSENNAVLSAQAAGTLLRIVADRGSRVNKGDTLLVLDSRRYRAALEAAEAQAGNARLDSEMAERLYQNGQGISENDLKKARNGLKMVEAALANARIDLENCFITAPQAGTVAERFVNLGELVAPGTPLLQLVQGELKVRCGLPESQSAGTKVGMDARVSILEAGIESAARVTWVGSVLDARSRTLPIELSLAKQGALRPGMACQVELEHDRGGGSLVVPVTLVQTAPDHVFVFVEADSHAVRRVVTMGERNGDQVEILAGLKAGDKVIVSGHRGLADGQALNVVAGSGRP